MSDILQYLKDWREDLRGTSDEHYIATIDEIIAIYEGENEYESPLVDLTRIPNSLLPDEFAGDGHYWTHCAKCDAEVHTFTAAFQIGTDYFCDNCTERRYVCEEVDHRTIKGLEEDDSIQLYVRNSHAPDEFADDGHESNILKLHELITYARQQGLREPFELAIAYEFMPTPISIYGIPCVLLPFNGNILVVVNEAPRASDSVIVDRQGAVLLNDGSMSIVRTW